MTYFYSSDYSNLDVFLNLGTSIKNLETTKYPLQRPFQKK